MNGQSTGMTVVFSCYEGVQHPIQSSPVAEGLQRTQKNTRQQWLTRGGCGRETLERDIRISRTVCRLITGGVAMGCTKQVSETGVRSRDWL